MNTDVLRSIYRLSADVRYMDVLKEGLGIRAKIRANKKEMKVIAKTIRRDKNETIYNLQKFDDEIAQLDQDVAEINRKKKEALTTFDTVTRTIISDEITANNKEEIGRISLRSLSHEASVHPSQDRNPAGYGWTPPSPPGRSRALPPPRRRTGLR